MATTFIGTKKRLTFTTRNALTDALANPTLLTVTIDPPSGASIVKAWPTDPEVVQSSTGVFYIDYTTTVAGMVQVRGAATGALVVAAQTSFVVAAVNAT